jgi:hypothetical protein
MYLLAALVALVGAGLAAGPAYELQLAALTTLVLVVAARRHERARVAALIAIAMAGEVLGSLVLHLYAYRGGGIPAFVPPGHGLLFLTALRLRHDRRAVVAAIVATAALAATHPDAVGVVAAIGLTVVLVRSKRAPLYAVMVLLVDALELYGTAVGTWACAHPLANPPAGVALGYVAFDALALAVIRRARRRAQAPCTWPKHPARGFAPAIPGITTPAVSSTARSIAVPA